LETLKPTSKATMPSTLVLVASDVTTESTTTSVSPVATTTTATTSNLNDLDSSSLQYEETTFDGTKLQT
jgi:hypothetical protein